MLSLTKKIATIVIALLLIFIVAFIIYRYDFLPSQRGLKIDNTAILIEEVKNISQLFTASYHDQLALDTFKYQEKDVISRMWDGFISPRPGFRKADPNIGLRKVELVVIANGQVMAGYDFSKLQPSDLQIEDKTVTMTLPQPEILEIIINPSDYEIFIEEGRWSLDEAVGMKIQAAELMKQRAIERGILKQSEATAQRILQNYFLSLGFETVILKTASEDVSEPLRLSPSLE